MKPDHVRTAATATKQPSSAMLYTRRVIGAETLSSIMVKSFIFSPFSLPVATLDSSRRVLDIQQPL